MRNVGAIFGHFVIWERFLLLNRIERQRCRQAGEALSSQFLFFSEPPLARLSPPGRHGNPLKKVLIHESGAELSGLCVW